MRECNIKRRRERGSKKVVGVERNWWQSSCNERVAVIRTGAERDEVKSRTKESKKTKRRSGKDERGIHEYDMCCL